MWMRTEQQDMGDAERRGSGEQGDSCGGQRADRAAEVYAGAGEAEGNLTREGLERLALQKGERSWRERRAARGLQGEWRHQVCVSEILGGGGSRQGRQEALPEPQPGTETAAGGRRKPAGSEARGGSRARGFGVARRWDAGWQRR